MINKICPTCKKEFKTFPSRKAIYCNKKCYIKTGSKNPKWHGGYLLLDGYKYTYSPQHPFHTKMGYVAEHRLIIEKSLGRYLSKQEVIHHINGNRLDNQLKNLVVCTSPGKHVVKFHVNRNNHGQFSAIKPKRIKPKKKIK